MQCKGTKNAGKSIICQIKNDWTAMFLMFSLSKCKRIVEQYQTLQTANG